MCIFIKDNDEQCGMSNHDGLWCRHHEDSRQARAFSQGRESAQSGSKGVPLGDTCGECESQLRRRERLREHPNYPRQVVVESYIECDCSEHVLEAYGVVMGDLPGGWT